MIRTLVFLAALLASAASPAQRPAARPVFVTLGTSGGPVPNPARSQPANAVLIGDDILLLDTGDGAVGRLAAAGLRLDRVRAVLLSHLHLDHTAGLAGVIGLRWMNDMPGTLRIYGPPGTRALVDGIVASMAPARSAGFGLPGQREAAPVRVEVIEVGDGAAFEPLAGTTARAVENSHYSFPAGSPEAARSKALSFRIDAPGRSIVYTGDTGPSEAVTRLARGADLLVSEVQDLPAIEGLIRSAAPNMPAAAMNALMDHLRHHHLSPAQVGEIARQAGVGAVVLTHLGPAPVAAAAERLFLPALRAVYHGPVTVAVDLGRY